MNCRVSCYACGESYALSDRKRCECGEPLWFDADPEGFAWPDDERPRGVYRYADVLPVSKPVGIGSAAGATPLVRTPRLDAYVGCSLSLKSEGQNLTGSFKDRGSTVGVSYAANAGTDWIGTVSHGNMALSVSAHAASAGLECAVFVPIDTPEGRLELIARHDPRVFRVEGDYGKLYEETLSLDADVEFVNSDTPLRVAGQKTVAYEICERFAPEAPDAIALPVSSGGQTSAVWKALLELEQAGLLEEVPRLYPIQAAACDPIAAAYREDWETVTPIDADETIAVSIANADPPSGTRALAAARATDGAVVSVDEAAIEDAMNHVATVGGLSVEPSSAVAIAGLRALSEGGDVNESDDVVAIMTGNGYKERYGSDAESRTIELAALETELATAMSQ